MTPNKDTIIIQPDPTDDAQVADIKSEYLAGLKSESVAGFELECMADFIGIRSIRDAGGITIAQKLETADFPDMPASAIASGCVDFILSPEEIAQKIVSIAHGTFYP